MRFEELPGEALSRRVGEELAGEGRQVLGAQARREGEVERAADQRLVPEGGESGEEPEGPLGGRRRGHRRQEAVVERGVAVPGGDAEGGARQGGVDGGGSVQRLLRQP